MALTRRQLLKRTGLGLGAVAFAGCTIPDREMDVQSPGRLPEDLVEGFDAFYATLCRQCPSPEGILVRVMEGRAKKIEGNPDYPLNQGKHSARCEASLQALYHPDRIRFPLLRDTRGGSFSSVTWDKALDELVTRLRGQQGDPGAVVLVTEPLRGHLGMVVERFMNAYGGQHLSFETLEETVLREAVKQVFGQEQLPQFDIEHAQYVLSFGADFLGSWLSPTHYSRQYGEFRQGQDRTTRGTLVQVEPRFSLTAANADEWVPVKPGTEGMLALSIASVIIENELVDAGAARAFTGLVGEQALVRFRPEVVAGEIGEHITPERIRDLARAFVENQPSLALAGGSAGGHTNGLFNLTAAYALNLLVGNVGKPGGVLFNPGSPLEDVPEVATATTFQQWTDLAGHMQTGGVQVVLVRGVDPVHGLPGATDFRQALDKVPFIVAFSSFIDETTAMADLVLPDQVALEDWGDDIPDPGPGFQTVGFQQPVVVPFGDTSGGDHKLVPPGEPRGFADVLLTVAEELGGRVKEALPWESFRDVLREGAQRLHDRIGGRLPLADGSSTQAPSFEAFWMGLLQRGGWWDTKATAQSSPAMPRALPVPASASFVGDEAEYPCYLVPFPSHSLGDGRGAHLPWLQATPDPLTTATWRTWVEVNPKDARNMGGLREGDVVEVESPHGAVEALVYIHPAMPPGVVSVPLGQGHGLYSQYAEERGANIMKVLAPQTVEGTGALAWAATRVRLNKTGRRTRIPKAEGMVVSIAVEGHPVVQVTRE